MPLPDGAGLLLRPDSCFPAGSCRRQPRPARQSSFRSGASRPGSSAQTRRARFGRKLGSACHAKALRARTEGAPGATRASLPTGSAIETKSSAPLMASQIAKSRISSIGYSVLRGCLGSSISVKLSMSVASGIAIERLGPKANALKPNRLSLKMRSPCRRAYPVARASAHAGRTERPTGPWTLEGRPPPVGKRSGINP